MGGTRGGGIKSRDKIKAVNPDHYKEAGAVGGKARVPNKGFGASHERAVAAGRKAQQIRRQQREAFKLQ